MSEIEPDFTELSAQSLLQREYIQNLEQLVRRMETFISHVPDLDIAYGNEQEWKQERVKLLLRAHQLLPRKSREPLEGISGI